MFAIGLEPVAPRWLTVSRAVMGAVGPQRGRQGAGRARRPFRGRGVLDRVASRSLKLVIADDHKGLRAAAWRVFAATRQRRRIRWMRNALAHAPAKRRGAVAAMLKTIFAQGSKADAVTRWDGVATALREKQPKLAALMGASREEVLAYRDFPREHWPQIASSNPLERVNKEIKRRADLVGIFPNDEWTVARRHMGLESLARITDIPNHRLPAMAA